MKKFFFLLTLILFAGCQRQDPLSTPVDQTRPVSSSTLPGRAVVLLTEQAADALDGPDFSAVAERLGIRSAERIFPEAGEFEARHRAAGLHRWYRIRYDEGVPSTKAEADLGGLPGVESVQTPHRIKQRGYFNDKYYSRQWNLENDGSMGATFKRGIDINVRPVWEEFTAGSNEVIVAVIDGGIDMQHEDLQGVVIPAGQNGSRTFIDGYMPYKVQGESHGTHVAGTIGAISNNKIGVAGIAGGKNGQGGVRLLSCAIFATSGDEMDDGDDAAALVWAADHGAVIANNSWGYDYESESDAALGAKDFIQHNSATKSAIDYFIDNAGTDVHGNQTGPMKGGLVVFAAGNEGWSHDCPGEYERIIAVGAIGPDGRMAEYSNYGTWVDILAPGGSDSEDNAIEWIPSSDVDNEYTLQAGTSMACPHVSGVAALLVSYFGGPGFTNEDLKERLLGGARMDGFELPAGYSVGGGMLDAYGAFTSKVEPTDPDLEGITVSTDYDGDYKIKSHESLTVEYRIGGNDKKRLPVKFQSSCPGATATCSTNQVRMQIDALKAEPGQYSAAIRVGGTVMEVIEFTILENHAPQVAAPFEDQVLNAASAAPLNINLAPYFKDPDGEENLTYSVRFSTSGVAGGSVLGNILNLSPEGYGLTTVTVTACDARNAKCDASFTLIARNAFLDLDVYPNPATNYLYIRPASEARTRAALYSRSGAKVREEEAQAGVFNPLVIDVKDLAPGTYTLQVEYGGKQQTRNIVKY